MHSHSLNKLSPKVITLFGLVPWLLYYYGVASQGYPQFVVLPLYALFPAPLHTVWARTPDVYVSGGAVALVLVLLALGGLLLRKRRSAMIAALAFDICVLVLLVAVGIRHGFEKA